MAFERLKAELTLDASQWSREISNAQSDMSGLESSAQSMGQSMQSAGKTMTKGVTAPLVAMGGLAVKTAADFDSAMTQSIAIMGDVDSAMRTNMEETARDVAKTTTFSADEVAEAYFFMASAGMDAGESVEAMGDFANFAQAGMFDMAQATDILTDAASGLGMEMSDAADLGDKLVKANTLANASVEEFGTALTTKAAAAMREFGVETDDGIAALATFADQGLKGQRAGTALNRMIRDLASSANSNAEAFEEMGIEVFDAEGNMRSIADITRDVEQATEGMSTEQREAALSTLGLSQQAGDALALLVGNSEALDEYTGELANAGGTAQEVADKQLESFSAQLSILRSNVADLAIQFGTDMLPALRMVADVLQSATQRFGEMSPATRRVIIVVAALAAAIGPLLMLLGTMLITIAPAIGALAGLAGSFGIAGAGALALLGPIGLIIAAVALLAAAFATDFMGIRTTVTEAVATIMTRLDPLIQLLRQEFLETLQVWHDAFVTVLTAVQDLWAQHGEAVMGIIGPFWDLLVDIVTFALETMLNVIRFGLAILRGDWSTAFELLKELTVGAFGAIVELATRFGELLLNAIVTLLTAIVTAFVDWGKALIFGSVIPDIFNAILEFIGEILGALLELFMAALQAYVDLWADMLQLLFDVVSTVWEAVVEFLTGVLETIFELMQTAWTAILDFLTDTMSAISDMLTEAWNTISEFLGQILNTIAETFDTVWNAISEFLTDITNTISEMLQAAWDAILDFLTATMESIQDMVDAVWSAIEDFLTNTMDTIESMIDAVWSSIEDFLTSTMESIESMIDSVWSSIEDFLTSTMETIESMIDSIWSSIEDFLTSTMDTIESMIDTVWSSIEGFLTDTMNSIEQMFDQIWSAIENFIDTTQQSIHDTLDASWNAIHDTITGLMNDILTTVQNIMSEMLAVITNTLNDAKQAVSNAASEMVSIIRGFTSQFRSAGEAIMSAFADGVSARAKRAVDAARRAADRVRSMLPGSDADEGPLDDLTQTGPAFVDTIARGIRNNTNELVRASRDAAGAMAVDPDASSLDGSVIGIGAGSGMTKEEMMEAVQEGVESGMDDMILETLIRTDDDTIERIIRDTARAVIKREINRTKRGDIS